MNPAEIERALERITDNQVVQGELLNRLERVVDRNTEAIARNSEAIALNSGAIGKLADGMALMQAAMQRLFEHMDRFIRGLEANGHRPGNKET